MNFLILFIVLFGGFLVWGVTKRLEEYDKAQLQENERSWFAYVKGHGLVQDTELLRQCVCNQPYLMLNVWEHAPGCPVWTGWDKAWQIDRAIQRVIFNSSPIIQRSTQTNYFMVDNVTLPKIQQPE